MEILIKGVFIHDRGGLYDNSRRDILINKGIIQKIGKRVSSTSAKVIEGNNLHCSLGWMDIGTQLGEPGYEHRESTDTLSRAALRGGYTHLVSLPTTIPVVQTASDLRYLKTLWNDYPQEILPLAAMSKNIEGSEITEMIDLARHGAAGFSDGLRDIDSTGLLLRAVQYALPLDLPILIFNHDSSLSRGGQIHEGEHSIRLGLKGIPSISESNRVYRNISVTQYAESKIVLHGISSAQSLEAITAAENSFMATVPYLNLVRNDSDLNSFSSDLKVMPPLRNKGDQKKLWSAMKKGEIQAIVSNHVPYEGEKKNLEFPYASFGASGIETCFAAVAEKSNSSELKKVVWALSQGPRKIMNQPIKHIVKNENIDLTVWDMERTWTFVETNSKSRNNPYLGNTFSHQVLGIVSKGRFHKAI